LRWQRMNPYTMPGDWVFASPVMQGQQPYWPDNLMKRYIRPVARKAGIHKQIGWHTFRHTFGTLLKANGEDVKTVQELLRHATSRITLEVYTQAITSHKRAAQSKVVKMMVKNAGENAGGNAHSSWPIETVLGYGSRLKSIRIVEVGRGRGWNRGKMHPRFGAILGLLHPYRTHVRLSLWVHHPVSPLE
jgi:Phage integrase family